MRAAICLFVVVTIVSACAPTRVLEHERDRLLQRQQSFLAALSDRDVDRTLAHFAEDAVIHIAEMPSLHGHPAIRQFFGNVFRFLGSSEPVPGTLRVAESGDLAYTTGTATNTFTGGDGTIEYTGKYVLVWERREGDWLIVVYSLSSDAPAPGRR